jgi:DNA-binding response OmpR family regulator
MSSLQGKEILIIDDAADMRLLVTRILENDGAVISEAADVQAGIERIFIAQPHLIILDLQFEGTNGFDFLSIRQNDERLKSIPVLVLSAVNDREGVTRAVTLGARDYLLKPIRATQLLQKVRKILHVSSFAAHELAESEIQPLEVTVTGQILSFTEAGFRLESSVKFSPEHPLKVSCDALNVLAEQPFLKTSSRPALYIGPSRYGCQVAFTGVGEAFVKKLKKAMGA